MAKFYSAWMGPIVSSIPRLWHCITGAPGGTYLGLAKVPVDQTYHLDSRAVRR